MRRAYLPVLLSASLAACATSPRPFNEPLLSVPELMAKADQYHGKTIFVEGFASVGTKSNALCPDPVPAQKECLALHIDFGPTESARVQWQALDGRPVEIRGTFNKANTALENVTGAWLEDWK